MGYTPILYIHTAQVACKFAEIHNKIDRKTGRIIEEEIKFLKD